MKASLIVIALFFIISQVVLAARSKFSAYPQCQVRYQSVAIADCSAFACLNSNNIYNCAGKSASLLFGQKYCTYFPTSLADGIFSDLAPNHYLKKRFIEVIAVVRACVQQEIITHVRTNFRTLTAFNICSAIDNHSLIAEAKCFKKNNWCPFATEPADFKKYLRKYISLFPATTSYEVKVRDIIAQKLRSECKL